MAKTWKASELRINVSSIKVKRLLSICGKAMKGYALVKRKEDVRDDSFGKGPTFSGAWVLPFVNPLKVFLAIVVLT